MPELPEVETLKLGLQKYIKGLTIQDVDVRDSKLVEGPAEQVIGSKITNVRRLAKGILIDLDNGYTIAFHIKLTGQLIFRDEKTKDLQVMKPTPYTVPNKFTRVVISLTEPVILGTTQSEAWRRIPESHSQNSGQADPGEARLDKDESKRARMTSGESSLYFQEVRGFAWMKILKTKDLKQIPFFKTLGPELIPSPGSDTPKLTKDMFEKIVTSSNLPIKVLLMEQKKIGGIGNIYANDGLFDAQIDPRRRAKSLTREEINRLYDSLMKVLEKGLQYRGSSELNFVDALGQLGQYQKHFLVYGKKGKKCERCGGVVQKIYLGGRGTYFCLACQR